MKPEDIGKRVKEIYGDAYSQYSDEYIGSRYLLKHGEEKTKASLGLSDSSTEPRQVENIQDITQAAQDLTAGERTKVNDAIIFADEVKNALDLLNKAESSGLPGASGPITNLLAKGAGAVGIDTPEAALRDQLASIVQLIRKERTGVAFSPEEQKQLEEIFGTLKTQEGPLRRKLEDLLAKSANEVALKANVQREQVDPLFQPESQAPVKGKGPLYNLLVKPYEVTAGNVGALGQVGLSSLVGKFNPQAGAQLAQEGQFGGAVQERSRMASEEPLKALFQQGLASADIAGQAKLLKGAGKLATGAKARLTGGAARETGETAGQRAVSVIDKLREKTPKSILSRKQAEAAARTSAKPIKERFIEVGQKIADQDPDVAKEFVKQKEFLNKIDDIPTLLDRMQTWGRRAFLKTSGIRSSAKAELYKDLYAEGLRQLKELAPEVYKNRQLLRLTFELPKQAGRALWRATLGKLLIS